MVVRLSSSGTAVAAPHTQPNCSIELLRYYVNLNESNFRLLIGWLAAAPAGWPLSELALHGEQGSAKSTLARIVRMLIDPQASPLLAEPRGLRDLMVTAVNGWRPVLPHGRLRRFR